MVLYREVRESTQRICVVTRREDLKISKADKTWANSANHSAGLKRRIAIVEHVSHHLFPSVDQAKRARAWNTKMMHCFTAKVFTDRRPQNGQAIRGS